MRLANAARAGQPWIRFIDGNALTNQTSDGARSLSLTTHAASDMLVALTGNRTATAPALLSGYTNILTLAGTSGGASRSLRLQFKKATSASETISWTGAYGYVIALRNGSRIAQSNTLTVNNEVSTLTMPSLSSLNTTGKGFLLCGTYSTSTASSVSAPLTLLAPASTANRFAGAVANNTSSSFASATITYTGNLINFTYVIEVLP